MATFAANDATELFKYISPISDASKLSKASAYAIDDNCDRWHNEGDFPETDSFLEKFLGESDDFWRGHKLQCLALLQVARPVEAHLKNYVPYKDRSQALFEKEKL